MWYTESSSRMTLKFFSIQNCQTHFQCFIWKSGAPWKKDAITVCIRMRLAEVKLEPEYIDAKLWWFRIGTWFCSFKFPWRCFREIKVSSSINCKSFLPLRQCNLCWYFSIYLKLHNILLFNELQVCALK